MTVAPSLGSTPPTLAALVPRLTVYFNLKGAVV